MKFYRVHTTTDSGLSAGYEFFTSKAEAGKAVKEWTRGIALETDIAEIDVVEIEPTKAGILRALNLYAVHADNG